MATKKLISFTDDQMAKIGEYSDKYKKTFTESVRRLIDNGLKQAFGEPETESVTFVSDGIAEKLQELEEEVKKLSWWTTDDNTSRLGNLETHVGEMQKSLNVLTAAMKLFKMHLKNREIHLQD
jgi:hypothetical protein